MSALAPRLRRHFGGATAVGVGILLSRLAGLVRERALAYYLGASPAAGALRAALRIPNILQNLLGEGVLSASFVPVYARLLAAGRIDDARRLARTIGTLLVLVTSLVAVLGMAAAGPLVDVLAPGFDGEVRALTEHLVVILFPGIALLVMSAWCLGVLSGHRRFFMSYAAPVLWNLAIIVMAIVAGEALLGEDGSELALWIAWGTVIGAGLQLGVQLPSTWRLLRGLRPALAVGDPGVRTTVRTFAPVLLGRGSMQLSSYLDQVLATYLGPATVAALGYAQILYMLPISLFGMAISAAELPEMAALAGGDDAVATQLRARLSSSLRRVVFLVMPSAIAFVAIGGTIVGLLFQTGRFTADDTRVVWLILAGSAIGLTAGTQGRLLASACYALGAPRPPLYAALVRVLVTFAAGWALVFPVRAELGYDVTWAAFGLTASAGVAAWIEFELLRRWLVGRIGGVPVPHRLALGTAIAAGVAGAAAAGVIALLAAHVSIHPMVHAAVAVPLFGVIYLGLTAIRGVPEAQGFLRRLGR